MSDRTNPVTVYLTDAEKAQVEKWADETDSSISALSRDAILEYTDRDRAARIEDKLDRVLDSLGDGEHTHTNSARQMSVPETARSIARRVYDNHAMPVRESDVELAIEDLGGATDRTIQQYKTQLKKRGLLYRHPAQPIWTDDKREWVEWVENAHVDVDVYDVTDDYRMDSDEYTDLAKEVSA